MVMYVDNNLIVGWYFCKEGCYYGDGTEATANRIVKAFEVQNGN